MRALRHLTLTLLLGVLGVFPISAQENEKANDSTWQALEKGGLVILMRHSLAPGIGDPPGFELSQCDTQRNLSAAGRALRARDIPIAAVYSSRWCRALDTAELMVLGPLLPGWIRSFAGGVIRRQLLKPPKSRLPHGRERAICY